MSKPKLSLVIPCYNEENTLEQIVEYVIGLKSESLDLELVIVDDCSKDKSLEKAEGLKKKYPDFRRYRFWKNHLSKCIVKF